MQQKIACGLVPTQQVSLYPCVYIRQEDKKE